MPPDGSGVEGDLSHLLRWLLMCVYILIVLKSVFCRNFTRHLLTWGNLIYLGPSLNMLIKSFQNLIDGNERWVLKTMLLSSWCSCLGLFCFRWLIQKTHLVARMLCGFCCCSSLACWWSKRHPTSMMQRTNVRVPSCLYNFALCSACSG